MPKTIQQLIGEVYVGLANEPKEDGQNPLDVSPSDVGRICGLFLAKIAQHEPRVPNVDQWLQMIANECFAVQDE